MRQTIIWYRSAGLLTAGVGIFALAACSDPLVQPGRAPSRPAGGAAAERSDVASSQLADKVALCHLDGEQPIIIEVGAPALAAHLAHGDYVTTLRVDRSAAAVDDGVHFRRIGDALGVARAGRLARGELRAAACRITILISAGSYPGSTEPTSTDEERFPLLVDVPDITLHGALAMQADAEGRADGGVAGGAETILSPTVPLPVVANSSTPLILANAHPGGSAADGLRVEGLVFRSGHDAAVDAGGQGVLSMRTERLTISGNRFEAGFTESLDIRGGSAAVLLNQLGGTAGTCDVCLSGPGHFQAIGNRLGAGGIPGLGVSGVVSIPVPAGIEPMVLPADAETWAEIRNNAVSDHQRIPVGVGIRVDAVGVGAPNVHNVIHAAIVDNLLERNRFGIIVHAAFPVPGTLRRADVDVRLGGNTFVASCQAKLLVSLSRHTTALGLTNNPYLLSSTFRLDLGGDLRWSEAWYGHPAGLGNTLIVDGEPIANGNRQYYDATGCPGA